MVAHPQIARRPHRDGPGRRARERYGRGSAATRKSLADYPAEAVLHERGLDSPYQLQHERRRTSFLRPTVAGVQARRQALPPPPIALAPPQRARAFLHLPASLV